MAAGSGGQDPATRVIRASGTAPLTITENGDVYEGENIHC